MLEIMRRGLFDDTLDDIFRSLALQPFAARPAIAPIRVDVSESENAYRLKADLPGVRKEDISVTVEGDTVTIAAEVKVEKESKDADDKDADGKVSTEAERVVRAERWQGKVARSFTLPQEVDEAGAEARYVDGVLELVLPKKAAATRKRLTVN